jgi:hypothetical protein
MTNDRNSGRGYSADQVASFEADLRRLRDETAGVQMLLHDLAGFLTKPRARTFANEGVGRRLPLVARCAVNVFKLFPLGTTALLSHEECNDIAIQVQAFAINVYAIFDNIAWVCMLEAGGMLPQLKVSVFKKECQAFIPQALLDYLSQDVTTKWFNEYGKLYRDSTAHRIPPYLPSRAYTLEEGQRFNDLDAKANAALLEAMSATDRQRVHELLDRKEAIDAEKHSLGSNSLLLALSLTGEDASPPVYLHPQLLCDWSLVNELLQTFDRSMREHYGWPAPVLPKVHLA